MPTNLGIHMTALTTTLARLDVHAFWLMFTFGAFHVLKHSWHLEDFVAQTSLAFSLSSNDMTWALPLTAFKLKCD